MLITYMLVLVVSAWLITYGLTLVRARLYKLIKLESPLPPGAIALTVSLALLIVVAAPSWLFLAVTAVLIALCSNAATKLTHPRLAVLAATAPLVIAPFLGASYGFALDAAIIAAALLGETHAS